ncbi:hypothetical protein AB4Z52_05025 [Rhizobium sp. 2YAF20]|uniref:hypothetical protein n=1 Tax=Rhizobium sp. 2YAF20 TaxID=3233027 RepID=UPI003F963D88
MDIFNKFIPRLNCDPIAPTSDNLPAQRPYLHLTKAEPSLGAAREMPLLRRKQTNGVQAEGRLVSSIYIYGIFNLAFTLHKILFAAPCMSWLWKSGAGSMLSRGRNAALKGHGTISCERSF